MTTGPHRLIATLLLLLSSSAARAFGDWSPQMPDIHFHSDSHNNSRSSRDSGPTSTGPSPAQVAGNAAYQRGLAAFNQGNWAAALDAFAAALKYLPNDPDLGRYFLRARAEVLNDQGVAAYRQQNWALAVERFQAALQDSPDDTIMQKSLARARARLATQRQAEHNARVADQIHQQATALVHQLHASPATTGLGLDDGTTKAVPAGGGLSFPGANSPVGAAPPPSLADQAFGDPGVADARHVPSGLPKFVEDSIPSTPAGERVRKGFEAISDDGHHDWKAGLAWFQEALQLDPGNPALRRLVDLAQATLSRRIQTLQLPFEDNSGPITTPPPPPDPDKDRVEQLMFERQIQADHAASPPPPGAASPWSTLGNWLEQMTRPPSAPPARTPRSVEAVRN